MKPWRRTSSQAYYRDGAALFSLTLEQESQASACASIRALIGEQGALAGDAVDAVAMQQATSGEVMNAMLIAIPLILLLLILSTPILVRTGALFSRYRRFGADQYGHPFAYG